MFDWNHQAFSRHSYLDFVNGRTSTPGETPLMLAYKHQTPAVVDALLYDLLGGHTAVPLFETVDAHGLDCHAYANQNARVGGGVMGAHVVNRCVPPGPLIMMPVPVPHQHQQHPSQIIGPNGFYNPGNTPRALNFDVDQEMFYYPGINPSVPPVASRGHNTPDAVVGMEGFHLEASPDMDSTSASAADSDPESSSACYESDSDETHTSTSTSSSSSSQTLGRSDVSDNEDSDA